MARYRATIKGQRGEASRLGSQRSGIAAFVNGWNAGVAVEGYGGPIADAFDVYMTGGSNAAMGRVYLGRVILRDGKPTWEPAPCAR